MLLALACGLLVAAEAARSTQSARAEKATAAGRTPAKPHVVAKAAYERLTPRERVGQLFIIGVLSTAPSRSDVQALRSGRAGNVFLFGNSNDGRSAIRDVVSRV